MPTIDSDALAWVLGVPDSSDFVATHLGQAWFHSRDQKPDRFAELLSLGQLDEILGTFGVQHPGIRLVRADEDIPASEYVWRDKMADPAQVARLFTEGATVIFGALHDRHEGTRRLCSAVTHQVSARSQANIYLTPPGSQGFKPHWDTHDVYVLQVEGSKRWRIYAGGPELPLRDQKFDPDQHAPGEVEAEFTLEAGETLYIPRGIMHAAVTRDAISLHITLGVMAYTWSHLLVDGLSELVERSASWRTNLPFGFARGDVQDVAIGRELGELLQRLAVDIDLPTVVAERQRARDAYFRPRAIDRLRQAAGAAGVREEDRVRWHSGTPGRIEHRNGRVVVVSGDREVEFPAAATKTLECLLAGEPVPAAGADDGLDWDSRRVVLSALIREGLITNDSRGDRSSG